MFRQARSDVSPSRMGASALLMRWICRRSTANQSAATMAETPVIATAAATTKGLDWSVGLRGLDVLLCPAFLGGAGETELRVAGRSRAVSLAGCAGFTCCGFACPCDGVLPAPSDSGAGRADCSANSVSNSIVSSSGGGADEPARSFERAELDDEIPF